LAVGEEPKADGQLSDDWSADGKAKLTSLVERMSRYTVRK
jgi:hypothetical protein